MRLEFPQLEQSSTELAMDLWREGIFVKTEQVRPPGTEVAFSLQLGGQLTAISGRGEVAWVRSRSEGPERPTGMEIRFLELDAAARDAIDRWIGKHGERVPAGEPAAGRSEVDEELQAGVDAIRMILGDQGEPAQRTSTEAELARAKAALRELRQRSRTTLDELEGRLAETQERLEELRRANALQAEELREASAARESAESRAAELEDERSLLGSKLETIQAELASTRNGLEAATGRQQEQVRRIEELEGSLAAAESSRREAAQRLAKITELHEALKKESGALAARHRALQEEYRARHDELKAIQAAGLRTRRQAEQEQAKLRGRLESLEAAVGAAEQARTEVVQRLETAAEQRAHLGAELDALRAGAEQAEKELASAQAGLEARNQRIGQLENELAAAESRSRETAERLRQLAEERDTVESERAELESRSARLRAELEASREEHRGLQKSAAHTEADLRARLEVFEAGLATAEEARTELTRRVEESVATGADAERRAAELSEERDRLGSRLEAARAEVARLEAARAEVARLEESLSGAAKNDEVQRRRIEELEAALAAAESATVEVSQRLEEARRSREILEEEGVAVAAARGELEREIESLRAELGRAHEGLALEERLSAIQHELAAATMNNQQLIERVDELRSGRDVDKQQLLEALAGRGELERALEDSQKEGARLGEILRATRQADQERASRLKELEGSLAEAAASSEARAEQLREMTRERDALRVQREADETARDQLRTELDGVRDKREAELHEAAEAQSALRREIERLQDELAATSSARGDFDRRLEEESEARAGAEQRASKLAAELEAVRSDHEKARESEADLRERLERVSTESLAELERARASLESALEEQRQGLRDHAARRKQAEETEKALRRDLANLMRQLEAARERDRSSAGRVEELQAAVQAAESASARSLKRLEEATLDRKNLLEKLSRLESAHGDLKQRLAATQAGAASLQERAKAEKSRLRDERGSGPRQRKRPRRGPAVWLIAAALVAALSVLWLLRAESGDEPAVATTPGSETARPPEAVVSSAAASDLGPGEARGEDLPPEPIAVKEAVDSVSDRQRIVGLLEAWARAWSEQRVDDYLAFYSPEFRSTEGRSLEAWAELRRQRILGPEFIQVTLDQIEVELQGPDRAAATFLQSYASESFSDRVVKRLELVRTADGWRVLAEETALS